MSVDSNVDSSGLSRLTREALFGGWQLCSSVSLSDTMRRCRRTDGKCQLSMPLESLSVVKPPSISWGLGVGGRGRGRGRGLYSDLGMEGEPACAGRSRYKGRQVKVSFSAPWPAVICAAENLISLAVAVYKKAKNSHLAHLAHGAQCRRAGRAMTQTGSGRGKPSSARRTPREHRSGRPELRCGTSRNGCEL